MHITRDILLTVEPAAEALVTELGLQSELEKMLEHARQTIGGLQRLQVKFAPAYDTDAEGIIIEAIREPSSRQTSAWSWDQFSRWKIATFPPDVCRHFTLLDN
jgi:hypothetical protein